MKAASKYVDVPVSATTTYLSVCLWASVCLTDTVEQNTYCFNHQQCLFSAFSDCTNLPVLVYSSPEPWPCCALQKPGMDVADGYVTFVRHSQDMLRDKVNEEVYIERLFDVSKMPSPPYKKGRGLPKCGKTAGQRGISPFWDQEMYFNLAEEAFLILYHFPLSFCLSSLWTLAAALCILVCIATVLLGLCVLKKRKLLFTKTP